MIYPLNNAVPFYAFFTANKVGKAGIAVTVDVYRGAAQIVAGAAATEVGGGLYRYILAGVSATPAEAYSAVFKTADATVDAQHIPALQIVGEGIAAQLAAIQAQTNLISAIVPAIPATSAPVTDPLAAETGVYWSQLLTSTRDLTGWTKATFTLKESAAADDDSEALLTVRVSNPPDAATDGILIHARRVVAAAEAMRTKGSVAIETLNPASARVTLQPDALALQPSEPDSPYNYEVDYWLADGHKRQLGKGDFTLNRSVRRATAAP
jgi:hypothetical protein